MAALGVRGPPSYAAEERHNGDTKVMPKHVTRLLLLFGGALELVLIARAMLIRESFCRLFPPRQDRHTSRSPALTGAH